MTTNTILQLPIDQLHESPFNPRRTFREEGLQELAADIKHQGVLSPLLVRPRGPELFRGTDDAAAQVGWELVFGHRRLRALQLAGAETAPCMVRAMTDEEVKRAQISENLERENVHAIEEAEGFQALMQEHGVSADELVAQTGKSRSYIYGRLKLLQAIPSVRQACLDGDFGADAALLIARLRHAKLQERALKAIEAKYYKLGDGGKKSFREIKRLLTQMFTLEIKRAVFDAEDATLVPSAGVCSACDKLSGNAPEYVDLTERQPGAYAGDYESGNPNLCTDPVCWDAKHKAHLVREAETMRAEGKVVVDGNKAKAALSADGKTVKGAYVALADVKAALKAAGKKPGTLPLVHIQDQSTGKTVQAVAAAELKALGMAKPEAPKVNRYGYAAPHTMTPAEKAAQEEKRKADALRADRLLRTCMAKLREAPRSSQELELVLTWALGKINSWDIESEWLAQHFGHKRLDDIKRALPTMSADDKGRLLLAIVMVENEGYFIRGMEEAVPEYVQFVAETHGVNMEAAMSTPMPDEVIEPVPTPVPAAQAPEGAKPPRGVRYWNAATGATWTGRGLQPAWLRTALASGKMLSDFLVKEGEEVKDEAGAGGAGGGEAGCGARTSDTFEAEGA